MFSQILLNVSAVEGISSFLNLSFRSLYPLTNKVTFEFENNLFRDIYNGYKRIYKEEEKEAGEPGTYGHLYNRRRSNGRYGIWGHNLLDLVIESIIFNPKEKTVDMFIGS